MIISSLRHFVTICAITVARAQQDAANCLSGCDGDADSCTAGCETAAVAVGSASNLYSCRSRCGTERQDCRDLCRKPDVEPVPILCQEFEFARACGGTVLDTVPVGTSPPYPSPGDPSQREIWEASEYTKECERDDYEPGTVYYKGSVFMRTATFCPDYPYPILNKDGGRIRSTYVIVDKGSCDDDDICTWRLQQYWSSKGRCGSDEEKKAEYHCADEAYFRANRLSPHLDTSDTIFCQDEGPDWSFVETPLEISCVKENKIDSGEGDSEEDAGDTEVPTVAGQSQEDAGAEEDADQAETNTRIGLCNNLSELESHMTRSFEKMMEKTFTSSFECACGQSKLSDMTFTVDCTMEGSDAGEPFTSSEQMTFKSDQEGSYGLAETSWSWKDSSAYYQTQELFTLDDGFATGCKANGCKSCAVCDGGKPTFAIDCTNLEGDLAYSYECADEYKGSFSHTFDFGNIAETTGSRGYPRARPVNSLFFISSLGLVVLSMSML